MRTLKGHTNEKNFVGLTVNSEYIACGSETNEVFVYHKVGLYLPASSECQHLMLRSSHCCLVEIDGILLTASPWRGGLMTLLYIKL